MSRLEEKIIRAVEEKGYKVGYIDYQPVGRNVEMIGREGGWTVKVEEDGCLFDYVLEYNVADVLEAIRSLPQRNKENQI